MTTIGCGRIPVVSNSKDSFFVKDERLNSPTILPDVSLSIIKTAESKTLESLIYSGGSWITLHVVAHTAILINHPQGSILFDTGLGNNVDEQFKDSMPFWLKPLMRYKKMGTAQNQLAEYSKINPIKMVILSHLHWDHASGIKDFPEAEIFTTRKEYDWAMDSKAPEGPYIRSQYSGKDIKWQYIQFNNIKYENFNQSLDLFHDGSVVLVPLPGHSLDGIGMFVNLKSGKRIFATGDTTWSLEGFQIPAHKFWFSSLLVDYDKQETELSIIKVHKLMQEYPSMMIVPAHDDKVQQAIGFYPKFMF